MNDFTKEELEQIVNWATTDIDLSPSKLEVNLFNKLQYMIDKYCEHIWRSSAINAIYCQNCQKHVEYEE